MTEKPIAWLIRAWDARGFGMKSTVMAGKMFKSEEAAQAAAVRLTDRFRLCTAFPVFNPTPEQLGLGPGHPPDHAFHNE